MDAKILGGSPHVAGSRVLVRRLFAFYKSGTRIETILRRYPQLEPAKVFDALAFALDNAEVMEADIAREREMLARSGAASPAGSVSTQVELPFSRPATVTAASANRPVQRGRSR